MQTNQTNQTFTPILRFLIVTACIIIILAGMRASAYIVNLILLALLLAIGFAPVLHWFQRKGLPNWLAFLLTILFVIIIVVALMLFLIATVNQFISALPKYQAIAQQQFQSFQETLRSRDDVVSQALYDAISLEAINFGQIFTLVSTLIRNLVNTLSNVLFLLLILGFMLLEAIVFPMKVQRQLRLDNPLVVRMAQFGRDIRRYIWITTWVGMLAGLGEVILLLVLKVDFALLWGILSWLMSYIPSIGYILALIPPFVLALLQYGWEAALIVLIGYFVINFITDQFIKPRYYGEGLNLSILWVFLSLVFWGWLLGPVGALLAIPLTILVKRVLLEGSEDTQWLAGLLEIHPEIPLEGSRDLPQPDAQSVLTIQDD
jgi:AI-2 transport protein TqsA